MYFILEIFIISCIQLKCLRCLQDCFLSGAHPCKRSFQANVYFGKSSDDYESTIMENKIFWSSFSFAKTKTKFKALHKIMSLPQCFWQAPFQKILAIQIVCSI